MPEATSKEREALERLNRDRVLGEVSRERTRQNEKFGADSLHTVRDPLRGLAVLGEEFGEVAHEVVEWSVFRQNPVRSVQYLNNARRELVQVAAVAVAMIQALDDGAVDK
jgi:NTP pyrophosphatase (non-canonical NTP hydrolase)